MPVLCALAVLALPTATAARAQGGPVNLGFDEWAAPDQLAGWWLSTPAYAVSAFAADPPPPSGGGMAVVRPGSGAPATGVLGQGFDASEFRGKRVRLRVAVRVVDGPRGQLWMRVDGPNGQVAFLDNMSDRPITAREWAHYEIIGDVADDAVQIVIGLIASGSTVALADASFQVLGEAPPTLSDPARPLTDRGLANVVAFIRLLGYIRFFHPSDEAAETDWTRFAVDGVRAVQDAPDAEALASRLRPLLAPVAPAVRVAATGVDPAPIASVEAGATSFRTWIHAGVDLGVMPGVYRSARVTIPMDAVDLPPGLLQESVVIAELGGGIQAAIPLAVLADAAGTLPRAEPPTPASSNMPEPTGFYYSADDRATRLAAIGLAWTIFQHFYPYFDVVDVDWDAVLTESLLAAAEAPGPAEFLPVLRRLVARLGDGHGNVSPGPPATHQPPFTWDWVEDQLVVTSVAAGASTDVVVGDVVLTIDGSPAGQRLADAETLISGATPGWLRYRSLLEVLRGAAGTSLELEVRRASGETVSVQALRSSPSNPVVEPRPEMIAELESGILYVDLDRVGDDAFRAAIPRMADARAIIFDLRGYPAVTRWTLGHLTDSTVHSAQWHIPQVILPDREEMTSTATRWPVQPLQPRFGGRILFLTDGRAISYAETYLGIVEHYGLGEIVGAPTAGTNGNVNQFSLPGGYTVRWTGMKVLKHDGSPHHGVGIQPTIPVSRTLRGVRQGRDEILERALELAREAR